MKTLAIAVSLLVMVIGLQGMASANLLTDPGFENPVEGQIEIGKMDYLPNIGGWTWSGGANGGAFFDPNVARTGAYSAKMTMWGSGNPPTGKITDYSYFVKELSGIDFSQPYNLSGYFLRNSADDMKNGSYARLKVEWKNTLGSIIRTDQSSSFNNSFAVDTWHPMSLTTPVAPAGSTMAVVSVLMKTSTTYSPNSTAYVDDMSFDVVPEPASLLLLGSGLVGLLGLTKRKKA